MPRYTLFFLDWDDRTVATDDLEAESDERALVVASERIAGHVDVEVMCENKTVGRPQVKPHWRTLSG